MENLNQEQTIVVFKIGRGGQFNNGGHLTYEGIGSIDDYTDDLFLRYDNYFDILSICEEYCEENNIEYDEQKIQDIIYDSIRLFGNSEIECRQKLADELKNYGVTLEDIGSVYWYTDLERGHNTGLSAFNDGTGCVDINGDYNTIYACRISELNDKEIRTIIRSNDWSKNRVLKEVAEDFGFDDLAIELMDYFNDWIYLYECFDNPCIESYVNNNYNVFENEDEIDDYDYTEIDGKFYIKK